MGSVVGGGPWRGRPGGTSVGPDTAQTRRAGGPEARRLGGPDGSRRRAGARHAGRHRQAAAEPGQDGIARGAGGVRASEGSQQREGETPMTDELDLIGELSSAE